MKSSWYEIHSSMLKVGRLARLNTKHKEGQVTKCISELETKMIWETMGGKWRSRNTDVSRYSSFNLYPDIWVHIVLLVGASMLLSRQNPF